MSDIGKPERATQNRIIDLFRNELRYSYLGDWTDRDGNSNIEEGLLTAYLTKREYTPAQINIAIHKLHAEADNHNRGLYGNNQAVYNLLRYGVPVKTQAGKVTDTTIWLRKISASLFNSVICASMAARAFVETVWR